MAIVSTVAASAAAALEDQGYAFKTESTAHLITALLTNGAVDSFDVAQRLGIPFVIDKPPKPHHFRPWEPQLYRHTLLDRAYGMLAKQEQRGQRLPSEHVQREIDALKVATTVIEHVNATGLSLYMHKLLLSPKYPHGLGRKLLAAMYDDSFGTSSCVAVGAGRLAPLPAASAAEFFRSFAARQRLLPVGTALSTWVASTKPYLIEFPEPDIEAGKFARLDRVLKRQPEQWTEAGSAELGMGFFLVSGADELAYSVITPVMFCRPNRTLPEERAWYFECKYETYRKKQPAGAQLADLIKTRKRHKFVQLSACDQCQAIHVCASDQALRPDLPAHCNCPA